MLPPAPRPSCRAAAGPPRRPPRAAPPRPPRAWPVPRPARPARVTIGSMTLKVAQHGGARQRAQLHAQHLGPRQRQAQAAQAEKRVRLAVDREARDRLVAARVERAHDHRPAGGPRHDAAVDPVLLLLVRQLAALEQELGAGQADAVAMRRIETLEQGRVVDVDRDLDPLPVRGQRPARRGIRLRPRVLAAAARRRCRASASVSAPGSRMTWPRSASSTASAPSRSASKPASSPTTSGVPRARASSATWPAALPPLVAAPT